MKMTSKQRVRAAVERKPLDRLPVMLWFEPQMLLKCASEIESPRSLLDKAVLGGFELIRRNAPSEQLANAAALFAYTAQHDYLRQLGSDIVDFHWFFGPSIIKSVNIKDGNLNITDRYGIKRSVVGLYLETVEPPCKTIEDVASYEFPDLTHPALYAQIRMYRALRPGASIACWVPGVQDSSQHWMGLQNLYTWMIERPDVIMNFFAAMARHSLDVIRGAVAAGADVIIIMDDYGSQKNLLMSKRMWERFTFPFLKMQVDEIHRLGALAMLHSCGHVEPLLDKIVESGADMLHPFQPTAGNNLALAKQKYGGELCFVTGIDAQSMSMMTPAQVADSIRENADVGRKGGGFVLSCTHYLQEDIPEQNIRTMFKTIKKETALT